LSHEAATDFAQDDRVFRVRAKSQYGGLSAPSA
jgi:hypothetical protein